MGVVTAAKILGLVGDVTRFPSSGHFARYTSSALPDASSGQHIRHRLKHRRQPPAQHHRAHHRHLLGRDPRAGRVYYQRKLAENKTRAKPAGP